MWGKAISLVISSLVTLGILLTFWTWLTPATFWQKVTGFLLSLAGGLVIFVFLQFFMMILVSLVVAKRFQGKIKKSMKGDKRDHEESMYI